MQVFVVVKEIPLFDYSFRKIFLIEKSARIEAAVLNAKYRTPLGEEYIVLTETVEEG